MFNETVQKYICENWILILKEAFKNIKLLNFKHYFDSENNPKAISGKSRPQVYLHLYTGTYIKIRA